jgi:tRNA threonylcarbamoyladenosine biosynthesis protein TsaE
MTISRSAADTLRFGEELAAAFQPGDVLALTGDLGAGKTCLVKGIARGLGITQSVTSPTFTLIHEYRGGRLPLTHVDLYRLNSLEQVLAIGLEDYLDGPGVTVIEWAEKLAGVLPARTRHLQLQIIDDTTRHLELT